MGFSETMKALSDSERRKILDLLKHGSKTVGEILSEFDMTGATLSYHLTKLKQAGLVHERKEKNFVYYSLNTSVLEEVMFWIQNLKGE